MSNYHLLPLDIIVTLNGTVMENPFISETIVKFKINSLVYIEKKKKKVDINFNAYHKTTERHLKPISKKLNCGHTIFLSGNLELVNGLKMIQPTSLSFVNSTNSNTMLDNQVSTTSPIKINPSVAKIAQQIMDNSSSTNEAKKRKETNTLNQEISKFQN
nr:11317_t:CDS:2 [Entrophospora candida]